MLCATVRADERKDNPFAKAIDMAQDRCVRLYGAGIGREKGYASGIIVSPNGHIITAQGIYLSGARLRVAMRDGRIYEAKVEKRSESLQVALLKIDAKTPKYFELSKKAVVTKGDWVMSVSNAFKVADRGEALSVNLGVITMRAQLDARHRTQDVDYDGDVLMYDAITSNLGAAGGAVVTADGKLAGMIGKLIASTSTNTRLNYAVPADQLRKFMDGEEPKKVQPKVAEGKPFLGIRLFKLSGKRAPAYVDRVTSGSPAAKAGIRKDDLVLVLGSEVVRSVRDYDEAFKELHPGDEIEIVVKRKNTIVRLSVVVAKESDE